MSVSQRVTIPPDIGKAGSFEDMRANAEHLCWLDTPQALPELGKLDRHSPSRFALLSRFSFRTAMVVALLGVLIHLFALGSALTIAAGIQLLPKSSRPMMVTWLVLLLGWGILLWTGSERTRDKLGIEPLEPSADLSDSSSARLSPVRGFAWLMAWAFLILGIAGVLLFVLHGAELALAIATPRYLDLEQPLWGLYAATLSIIAIVTFVLSRKNGWFVLLPLWGLGIWGVLVDNPLGIKISTTEISNLTPFAFIVIVMSLFYPLRIAHLLAKISLGLCRRWLSEKLRLLQGWRLRDSLSKAFARHRRRNQLQIAEDGRHAVCKRDLEYFVQQQAGPVRFWWCPVCQDDDQVYTRVRTVQGVLDTEMSVRHEQKGYVLRINLLDWRRNEHVPPPLKMHEVLIGELDNPHEVEWFILQYRTLQPNQRNWPPLHRIRAVITPRTDIDEHTRRQIQDNMLSV